MGGLLWGAGALVRVARRSQEVVPILGSSQLHSLTHSFTKVSAASVAASLWGAEIIKGASVVGGLPFQWEERRGISRPNMAWQELCWR